MFETNKTANLVRNKLKGEDDLFFSSFFLSFLDLRSAVLFPPQQ